MIDGSGLAIGSGEGAEGFNPVEIVGNRELSLPPKSSTSILSKSKSSKKSLLLGDMTKFEGVFEGGIEFGGGKVSLAGAKSSICSNPEVLDV